VAQRSSTLAGSDALWSSTRGDPGKFESHFPFLAQECEEGPAGDIAVPAGTGAEHPGEYPCEEQEDQEDPLRQDKDQEERDCEDEEEADEWELEKDMEPGVDVAPTTPPVEDPEVEKLLREAHEEVVLPQAEEEPLLPGEERGFVVSVSKLGWRRLHYLGGCSRVPGVHYLTFELLGETPPDAEQYNEVCRHCWGPKGKAPPLEAPSEQPGEISPNTSEAEEA